MSRNGAGVYSLPAGSTVANGDVSTADDLNIPLADIEADLNVARPIVAGGTGATTASAAATALGVGSASDVTHASLTLDKTSAATNTVTTVLTLKSQSSGTPATGIGVAIAMQAETSASNIETGAQIEAVTTDVTGGSEDFDLVIKTQAAGNATPAERGRFKSSGLVDAANGYSVNGTNGYMKRSETYLTSGTAATYTTPSKVRALKVTCVGGGGGSGGVDGTAGSTFGGSAGGNGGDTVIKWITSPAASYTYTVGAGGTAGVGATPTAGGNGGTTTFTDGSLTLTAYGGAGGQAATASTASNTIEPLGSIGTPSGGDLNIPGGTAGTVRWVGGVGYTASPGGDSMFSRGSRINSIATGTVAAGIAGVGYGGGASGAVSSNSATNADGAAGSGGLIFIEEFM